MIWKLLVWIPCQVIFFLFLDYQMYIRIFKIEQLTLYSGIHLRENQALNFGLVFHSTEDCNASRACLYSSSVIECAHRLNIAITLSFCVVSPLLVLRSHLDQLCSLWKSHRITVASEKKNIHIKFRLFTLSSCLLTSKWICWQQCLNHQCQPPLIVIKLVGITRYKVWTVFFKLVQYLLKYTLNLIITVW